MEDSFFGFDTSIPFDEDGSGQIAEPSEEEYDALNDETFGSAINTDWEEAHETMVRLTDKLTGSNHRNRSRNRQQALAYDEREPLLSQGSSRASTPAQSERTRRRNFHADSDLELNLSHMRLEEVDFSYNDGENSALQMDPSVWASNPSSAGKHINSSNMLFDGPAQGNNLLENQFSANKLHAKAPFAPKICTLEDIERNLILGQVMHNQQNQHTPTKPQQQHEHQQAKANNSQQIQQKGSILGMPQSPSRQNFGNATHQHPALANILQQQQQQQQLPAPTAPGGRMPPGFPPLYPPGFGPHPPIHVRHPLLNQHGLPMNFPHPLQRPIPSPHLPIALNNFAMHPNFSAMRAAAAVGLHGPPPPPPAAVPPPGANNNQQQYNMFNMRLMQEIQQNHPLLQQQRPALQQQQQQQLQQQQHLMLQQQQQRNHNTMPLKQQHHQNQQQQQQRHNNNSYDGKNYDEYANLMSTRDKHWLIGIQLSQLNMDTPYIDDYYYTVYKERQAELHGELRNSQAHKDNQLNHPLIQPRGHAKLILVQLGNKNGTRNGQNQRERRNSEAGHNSANSSLNNSLNNNSSMLEQQKSSYVFTPLKFENSLGKLQYGSVTAPRKIIDADIMSADNQSPVNTPTTMRAKTPAFSSIGGSGGIGLGVQRKSRHILLHIETLYGIVLKLEDLDNPAAVQSLLVKKKKESERLAALEQLENANKTAEERAATTTETPALKPKFAYEIEPKELLLEKLLAGLSQDKIVEMMTVRKGKILIRRVLPFITDNNQRWHLWMAILTSLQSVIKKDRDDNEGVLYALYPHFKKHIQCADFKTVVSIAAAMPLNDKKYDGIFCSRFGISVLVCLVTRAEEIYQSGNGDESHVASHKEKWSQFLSHVAKSLDRTIQNQTICAAIEADSIEPLISHVARFKDLKLDALLALIGKAQQQIN